VKKSSYKGTVSGSLDKKAEEDATFCFIKDGTFFLLFLSKEPGTGLSTVRVNT
jgi:hypothetical protein